MNKLEIWENIAKEVQCCEKCDLGCQKELDGHDVHVMGQGNLDADVMFIAEAAGLQETIHKRPLTPPGTSGKIFEKLLANLGLNREQVYTTNVCLCRPEKNRDPEPWEILKCKPFLKRQLELVGPKIIVTFGRFAAQIFLNDVKITRDHGQLKKSSNFDFNVFPLYHPAYIGAYAPEEKRVEFKNDVITLKKILENTR